MAQADVLTPAGEVRTRQGTVPEHWLRQRPTPRGPTDVAGLSGAFAWEIVPASPPLIPPATWAPSLTKIDCHYGHLAHDGRGHAIRLLNELSAGERPQWTLVDVTWTSKPEAAASRDNGNSG